MEKHISVFAGASCHPKKGKFYYDLAYETGKELAKAGFITVTGGGIGLMDEIFKGAFENGGRTVGIALNFSTEVIKSSFVHEISYHDKLMPRQDALIKKGDAFIAIPGGAGTMYEIYNILSLKRINEMAIDVPVILVGEYFNMFDKMSKKMLEEGFIGEEIHSYYTHVKTPVEAVEILKKHFQK